MKQNSFIGNRFKTAMSVSNPTLDNSVKRVLALKPILARILKGCVQEFADLPIEDIENKYIEGNPIVASTPVHSDENSPVITGYNTEHKSANEGTVTFDVKFNAIIPDEEGFINLIINVEGQHKTCYPILKRGIYYCGRMLSAQYGTVFTSSHYEKLRKVISIWICFDGTKMQHNTIRRYGLSETKLCGTYMASTKDYNLIDIIALYIGDDQQTDNSTLKLLDIIFSTSYNVAKKKQAMEQDFGIKMTEDVTSEVEKMCNYSEYVKESSKIEGRIEGRMEGKMDTLFELIADGSITIAMGAEKSNMSEESFRQKYESYKS